MLKSKAKWEFAENTEILTAKNPIMERLFHNRGLYTKEEQHRFLNPKLEDIHSPTKLEGITLAKKRILNAIENDEKIIVYGDYDADGVTSTALLIRALTEIGANCDYYIPNRFTEGYGLNSQAIKTLSKQGVTLVITVDNGIANSIEATILKQLGIDLIITDHHEVQEEIPEAYAVIHPALSPQYSFKSLAGVGVAFQLAHYLLEEIPIHLLDLAAIGTIADLVPLISENRIIVYHGLKQLKRTQHTGLIALKNLCKLDGDITARDIGFMIAPRINAVGRLQNARLAVELLLTEDREIAEQIAEEIEALNTERQFIVNQIVKEAEKRVLDDKGFIILYDEKWHEGVLGIAASRLVKIFDRPVMLLTYKKETNELKGSARSIPTFNLFENGMKIRHLFTHFGGHSQAAGMTFPFDNLAEIEKSLNEAVLSELTEDDFKQVVKISASISIDAMTEDLIYEIEKLAPFGMKNEEPFFHFKAKPTQLRQIGQEKTHLKIQFNENNHHIDTIGFGLGHLYSLLSPQSEIHIVGKLQINEWNGNRTIQILIEDIAVDEWQLLDFRGRKNNVNIYSYLSAFRKNVIVTNNKDQISEYVQEHKYARIISYHEDLSKLEKSDIVYVFELPEKLSRLEEVIRRANPEFIHVSYTIMDHAYLESIPTREEFKWLYAYLLKNDPIHLKIDLPTIMRMKRWTKDKIVFMLKVFLDLQFISVVNDVISVNNNVQKRELHTSKTYQEREELRKIEKTLYYSTYEELKQWFDSHLSINGQHKEEILHGL